jgi:hypothetical protein
MTIGEANAPRTTRVNVELVTEHDETSLPPANPSAVSKIVGASESDSPGLARPYTPFL